MAKIKNRYKKKKAIYLLVSCQQSVENTAKEIGIKRNTLQIWMRDEWFKRQLDESMARIESLDAKYRAKQNRIIADSLYGEIHNRIAMTNELKRKDMTLPTLIRMVKELNHEVRIDTPGDVTSKSSVEHTHRLEGLIQRFKDSDTNYTPDLKLIDMPEPEDGDKKEAVNE